MITIGIDPGWSSFGIAITKDDALLAYTSFVPKKYGTTTEFVKALNMWIGGELYKVFPEDPDLQIYIERFVTYGGTQTDPENILMLIGALDYFFTEKYSKPTLIRALDWKVRICHHLVKSKGLSNPGTKFDKKYSLWAAENLSGKKFKSDHEADAVCLSYMTPSRR